MEGSTTPPPPPGTFTAEHSPSRAPPPRRAVTGTNPAPDPAGPWEMLAERGASSPVPAQEGPEPRPGGQDHSPARPAGSPGAHGELWCVPNTVHRQAKTIKAAEPLSRVNWFYWGTAPTCLWGDAGGAGRALGPSCPRGTGAARVMPGRRLGEVGYSRGTQHPNRRDTRMPCAPEQRRAGCGPQRDQLRTWGSFSGSRGRWGTRRVS